MTPPEEMKRNEQFIHKYRTTKDGYTGVFEVATEKIRYMGVAWRDMSSHQKRKFENLLALATPNERIKIRYI